MALNCKQIINRFKSCYLVIALFTFSGFAPAEDKVGVLIEFGRWKEAVDACNSQFWDSVEHKGGDVDLFYTLKNLVYTAIAPSIRYEIANLDDKYHPHLSYEDNIHILNSWSKTLKRIEEQYGHDVLMSLEKYCRDKRNSSYRRNFNRDYPESAGESLEFLSEATYARLLLAIMHDKIDVFEEEWSRIGSYSFFSESLNIVDGRYGILCQISETFAAKSNPTMAISILQMLNKYVQEQNRFDLSENTDTYIATLAYPIGQNEIAQLSTFSAWATAQQPIETYKALFYDVNNLIKQLVIASYIDENNEAACLTAARIICMRDMQCQNGCVITEDTKALLYNALSLSANNLIERQQYLEQATSINPYAVVPYVNLALCLSEQGKYAESEEILAKVTQDEILSNNLAIHSGVRSQYDHVKVMNASAIDPTTSEGLLAKRLVNAEQTFLSFADNLTSEERTRYWDSQIGPIGRFFSKDEMLSYPCIAYDAALFEKGILARYERYLRDNTERSVNDSLKRQYAAYRKAVMNNDPSAKNLEYAFQYSYMKCKSDFNKFDNPSWHEVKAHLKKKEAAIEFYSSISNGKEDYYAIIITRDSPQPQTILLPGVEEIYRLYNRVNVNGGYSKPIYNTSIVWDSVWCPIINCLKGVSTVYYSPFGILHNINLEAATTPNGKLISEKYTLHRLSSTGNIINTSHLTKVRSAAIFGNIDYTNSSTLSIPVGLSTSRGSDDKWEWDELTNTIEEINSIGSTLSKKGFIVNTYEKDNGTESAFKSLSGSNTYIIHLATHGFYYSVSHKNDFLNTRGGNVENRSGLVLAGGNSIAFDKSIEANNDGVLTAGEIVGLDLSGTDMLVLSACQTGLGDVIRDGVYGIQRSFKIAGVNSIIMSLWKVNDASTELMMTQFYTQLASGKTKHDAFCAAVSAVKLKYKDPYNWAAFIMLD